MEGYSLTGQPIAGGAGSAFQPVPWDIALGWSGRCLPVDCGPAPALPHAERLGHTRVRFGSPVHYLCGLGYVVEGGPATTESVTAHRLAVMDPHRLVELRCNVTGAVHDATRRLCVPLCGDGLLVPTAHLPAYDPREQCDDGNREGGDGCSSDCRVEAGFVCRGGSPHGPDRCHAAEAFAESTVYLSISGQRAPGLRELRDATVVALSKALGCPERDLEILSVESSSAASEANSSQLDSRYHGNRVSAQVRFRAKILDPTRLGIKQLLGALWKPGALLPRIALAYADGTSLADLHAAAVGLAEPSTDTSSAAALKAGKPSISQDLLVWGMHMFPAVFYLVCIGGIVPLFYWVVRVRRRANRLMGRFDDIPATYKNNWTISVCSWTDHKALCCCLLLLLPTRLADTWDSVGLMPYWTGVRRSFCCCLLYLTGCCLCGAKISGHWRSEMRDFFDFGDNIKGNLEFADYVCYLCCPVCCVVQEAVHVDAAVRGMPPPAPTSSSIRKRPAELDVERGASGGFASSIAEDQRPS